jgi:hypothetical protein
VPSKQLGQHAGVIGFEVLYHHKDKAACRRDMFKELLQRFEPAGRRPQTNDQGGSRSTLGRSPVRRILFWLTTHECTSSLKGRRATSVDECNHCRVDGVPHMARPERLIEPLGPGGFWTLMGSVP